MTPSINPIFLKNIHCQISSRSDFKRRSLRLFEEVAPKKKKNSKMSCY